MGFGQALKTALSSERFGGEKSARKLLGDLDKIVSALRASADPGAEKGNAKASKDEDGRTIPIRQIDERRGGYDPQDGGSANKRRERDWYQDTEQDTDTGVEERKRRAKRSDLEDAGQQNLFASPDVSGDARKQQIIENQRVLVKHVETGTIRAGTDTLNGPQDVGHFIAPIRKLAQEEMYAIVLDGDNKVLNVIKHSKGQKNSASVSPWTVAGAVVATPNAKSVWFAHNHPSGSKEPSLADQGITAQLNDVLDGTGVVNNGHVVVSKGAELGVMDADGMVLGTVRATPMPRNKTFPITERQLRMNRTEHPLNDPDSARRIVGSVASPNAVILLNTRNQVTGVLPLNDNDLKTLRHPTNNPAAARIVGALDSTNSNQVLLKSTGSSEAMKGMRNLVRFFNRADSVEVLDHLRGMDGEYKSSRELGSDDLDERGSFYALRPESSARGGVQSGPLRLKMRPLEQRLNQPIHVLQAESELPSNLYRRIVADGVQGRVRGLFDPDSGATYLIAANLDNVGEATRTVLHELVGHKGIRSLLGNRLDTVLDEIHRDMSDRLKQVLGKRYARQTQGMSEAEANRLVAEEYLAHLAEKDPQNSLLGRIISMIRNALRRVFPNIKWTDADAVELLAAARQRLKRDGNLTGDGNGSRYSDAGRAPTFYSAVERSAAAVKADKMPAQSWLNAIKKGNNVQDEEIQWLGLDIYLADHQGQKLSKADVLAFIRQNEVRIDEELHTEGHEANEDDVHDALMESREEFIDGRLDDYKDGRHLDELRHEIQHARERLYDSEYEYFYETLKEEFEKDQLDDYDRQYLDDGDGRISEPALTELASDRAQANAYDIDADEVVDYHIDEDTLRNTAEYMWNDHYESDYRSDIEEELSGEDTTVHSGWKEDNGEDYRELILTLPDNSQVFAPDPKQRNLNPLTHEEVVAFLKGYTPSSLTVTNASVNNGAGWSVVRGFYTDNETLITTGHETHGSAIAAAISEHGGSTRQRQIDYTHGHWYGTDNPLAHVRFQTYSRELKNGTRYSYEKVLFIDEVQSDWHQQGRDRGYQTPEAIREDEHYSRGIRSFGRRRNQIGEERGQLRREIAGLKQERDELYEAMATEQRWGDFGNERSVQMMQEQVERIIARITEKVREFNQLEEETLEIDHKEREYRKPYSEIPNVSRRVPNAPLKESWPNLVMKRMIRYAAENGFDRIAWTNAVQQIERYDSIGEVISRVDVDPIFTSAGETEAYMLGIYNRQGGINTVRVEDRYLEDYIGHRLTDQVREKTAKIQRSLSRSINEYQVKDSVEADTRIYTIVGPDNQLITGPTGNPNIYSTREQAESHIPNFAYKNHNERFTLDGLNEIVGADGKGMQEFYDKRLVNFMKKYTKRWGARLEPVDIDFAESGWPYQARPDKVWSVPVTDQMKDSVLKDGQPLFALKDRKPDTGRQADGPRYALKGVPDEVSKVIDQVHGGGKAQGTTERLKSLWHDKSLLDHIKRGQLHVNQGLFNKAATIEHNEKLLNDGKLLDASESASKAFHLARNLDYVHEAMLWGGTPHLKNGSVVIKEGSQGLLDTLKPVAERDELKVWETWAASIRAKRLLEEDRAARAKGAQLLDRAKGLKATLDAVPPEQYDPQDGGSATKRRERDWYPGGRAGYERDRKQMLADQKQGRALSRQSRENLFDDRKINTIQNWVNTQPQLKARFEQVQKDYQKFNGDMLDFMVDAGLIDKDVRKLWNTDDYIPFHRVHDLEAKEQQNGGKVRKGLSDQKSGIRKLSGGVEQIAPLEAMVRNTRSMLDAAFKNIAMQRIVDDAERLGAVERVDALDKITDEEVVARLEELGMDTNLTPEQKRRWKALMGRYTEIGEGTVSASVNGKQQVYLVHDPLLLSTIRDLGQPAFSTLMKLVGIPRKLLTTFVTAFPDFMVRNLIRDTVSTAVHIAPEVNGKAVSLNPIAGAVRGFRKALDKDPARLAMMMGGGGGGGYYDVTAGNVRKMLSPDEQKRLLNHPAKLWQLWQRVGSRFENSNRLHVYEQTRKAGGSEAEAAYQAMDVMNFTRSGQWPLVQFMVQTIPFFNSMLQGVNRLWRGIKPGDELSLSAFSGPVIFRGMLFGLASWALFNLYRDDERYKELTDDDKLMYHHFWIGDGKEGHYRIPKAFEVGAIFATLPEIITQSIDGSEDMKWTRDMLAKTLTSSFGLDSMPLPQFMKPIIEVGTNRDRFCDQPILPLRLQNLKPEAQYDPYTSDTLKELVQLIPEGAPDWLRSPKKLEHLLKGYFGGLARYTLLATDAMTREATGAGDKPASTRQDNPLLASFVRDTQDG